MRRRSLLIDLTSLLDVILIILFLVLVTSASQASAEVEELSSKQKELESKIKELSQTQLPGTEEEQNWYQVYQEEVGRMEVYFPDDLQTESMRLIFPNGDEKKKPESDSLSDWLTKEIENLDSPVVIVTFSYRNNAIYWRDYTNLRDLLLRFAQTSDKTIFYKEVPRK